MMMTDDVAHATYTLRMDRERGAMELAMEAVKFAAALIEAAPDRDVRQVIRALATGRPSMAAIANAVALFALPLLTEGQGRVANVVRHEATLRIARWQTDNEALRLNATRHIPPVVLAYSNSSTTRTILLELAHAGRIERVIVPEGRPIDDGKRLAITLAAAGIPVTVITEAQMGAWVPQVGAVLVGADTIMPDGTLVNHMGTATLALLAEAHHIPMISVAHSLKVAPYHRPEDTSEENDPAEVWRDPPSGVTLSNPAFDQTPPACVTLITERGVLTDSLCAEVVAAHREAWIACGLGA